MIQRSLQYLLLKPCTKKYHWELINAKYGASHSKKEMQKLAQFPGKAANSITISKAL